MVGWRTQHGNRTKQGIDSLTYRRDQGWFLSGLTSTTGRSVTWQNTFKKKVTNKLEIPKNAKAGFNYMMGNNPNKRYMLSKNPQCSGGVGRKSSPLCKLKF